MCIFAAEKTGPTNSIIITLTNLHIFALWMTYSQAHFLSNTSHMVVMHTCVRNQTSYQFMYLAAQLAYSNS